ncbi:hypothetical protein EVC14_042 [Rhizobium phage RHph_I3_18]|nr:hypothetical protein EVC14_042 [Rhizobium phage RHph_I3_18]
MASPSKIRVAQDADGFWTCREAVSGSPEYVREDIVANLVAANRKLLSLISDALQDDFLDAKTDAGAILCGDVMSDAVFAAQKAIAAAEAPPH